MQFDNVEVLDPNGNNLVPNSTFESGSAGWVAEGTESLSAVELTEGYLSSQCYHVRAVDRGDNQVNRIRALLSSSLGSGTPNVTIRAAVRWLKGSSQILLRLRGNWLECAGDMAQGVGDATVGIGGPGFHHDDAPFGALDRSAVDPERQFKPVEFGEFTEAVKTLGLFWLLLNERAPLRKKGP